jgi:DNA-directed RNA polymerase specialized sigma24 family protein
MQPSGEQFKTILKVIDRIAPKYVFGYYTLDDIKQESYIICLEALEKYDGLRPFENFVSKHLSNRLKTLIRDKYSRSNILTEKHQCLNESKRSLVDLQPSLEGSAVFADHEDLLDKLSTAEAIEMLMEQLPPSMRNDFKRIANGVAVQSVKKAALFKRVKEIVGENW